MKKVSVLRKERDGQRHRKEIMSYSLTLFSDKGFHNVSMQEIADMSGFAVGSLYNFFENKEELYSAIINEKLDEIHANVMKEFDILTDEIGKVKSVIEAQIDFFTNNLQFLRLYHRENRGGCCINQAGIEKKVKSNIEEYLEKLALLFETGIKKGIFRDMNPYNMAIALHGIIHAFAVEFVEAPEKHPLNADIIMDLFFKSLFAKGGEK